MASGENKFWRHKRVLVTGGRGFIGQWVVALLLKKGARVTVVVKRNNGNKEKNAGKAIRGDLCDKTFAAKVCKHQDVVIHLAAIKKNIVFNKKYPATILRDNLSMTLNVLEGSRRGGVERIFISSSTAALGDLDHSPYLGYAWAKKMGEVLARAYREEYGMKIAVARISNTFGPGDNFDAQTAQVIPSLIRKVLSGESPIMVWGRKDTSRSFLYVEDTAQGILNTVEKYPAGDPVDLCSRTTVSVENLIHTIRAVAHSKTKIIFDSTKPIGTSDTVCDFARCKRLTGFAPHYTIREGLKKTISWYKQRYKIKKRKNEQ